MPLHLTSWRSILISSSHLPIYIYVVQVVSFPQISPPKSCMHLSSPHTCYTPRLSQYSWFDRPNNIWWAVQIIKLLAMQPSLLPCHLDPLRSRYLPQCPTFIHLQAVFFFQCKRPWSTPIKTRMNYNT
jgi:hypothetical protein